MGSSLLPGFDCLFDTRRKRGFIKRKRRQAAARFAGKLRISAETSDRSTGRMTIMMNLDNKSVRSSCKAIQSGRHLFFADIGVVAQTQHVATCNQYHHACFRRFLREDLFRLPGVTVSRHSQSANPSRELH